MTLQSKFQRILILGGDYFSQVKHDSWTHLLQRSQQWFFVFPANALGPVNHR